MSYREQLYQVAIGQNGFITTADAEAVGIPRNQVRLLASRNGLTHVSYGLYRFDAMPIGPSDEFMEAVLRLGPGAYLTHDSVLALHGLALVNPTRIRVGLPRRSRRRQPPNIEVIWRSLPAADLTHYDGVPSATVRRAIIDSRPIVMAERLHSAVDDALAMDLIRSADALRLHQEIQ